MSKLKKKSEILKGSQAIRDADEWNIPTQDLPPLPDDSFVSECSQNQSQTSVVSQREEIFDKNNDSQSVDHDSR